MIRPANHPHRRLGALAELVRRWKEFRLLAPRLDSVGEWIAGLLHPFWGHHFYLGSRSVPKPIRLLGEARVNEVLANVIQPMLVVTHQSEWESFKRIRAELGNRRLAIVCTRLFGDTERGAEH